MRPLDPRVLPYLRPAYRPLGGVLAGGTLGGLLTVAQAFALGTLLVRLVQDPGGSAWHRAAGWLAAIVVGRAVSAYVVDTASANAAGRVSAPLRRRLIEAALGMDAQSLSRHRTGELTLLSTRGMSAVEPYLTRYLPTLVLATVLPAATVAAIFWLDWLSGLIVVLTLPLVPVFAILIGLATRERAERQWQQLATLSGHFLDVVRGLPTLVAHRRAAAQAASIRAITDRYRRATLATLAIAFASSAALELIATISVALVAVSVGLRLASGSLDFWTAMVVLLLAPEAYWPLRRVGAEFHSAAEGTAAFEKTSALLQPTPVRKTRPVARPGRVAAGSPIEIDGLTLHHADRDTPALDDLTATIPGLGLTAIAGPSGCGKSTLLAGLLGELSPASGQIRIGGTDLADLDPDSWHALVAWSPQRPWLTAGTIADNLRVGRPGARDDQLWSALDQVALGPVVRALPDGLATALGEDGAGLSAGQRARLALARIVLADRPYVFLDEPTAHLDATTESVLLDTLADLAHRSCVVVVAHRPAVAEAADHVLTLPAPARVPAGRESTGSPQVIPAVTGSRPATVDSPKRDENDDPGSRFGARTGTLLGALSVASGVALTATASWLITRASTHPPVLVLMVAIVGVRAFGLARPALRYAERIVSHDAALRLLAERRARVYDLLVPLVPGRLGPRRGDVLASVVDDVDSLVDRRLRVRQPIATALWVGLGTSVFAGLASPAAGLVTAAVCAVGALGGAVAYRGVAAAETDFVRRRAALSTRVEEILRSARDLVVWQAADRALAALDEDGAALASAGRRSAGALATGRLLVTLAGGFGVLAMAAVVPAGDVSPAMLALLVMLPIALVDPLAGLPDAGALAVRTSAAEARLAALSAANPSVTECEHPRPVNVTQPTSAADAVTAGWGDRAALADFSLRVSPGARIGLVGASGTGKSTYAALMMRFLDPSSGRQTLAETDLRDLALDDVRRVTGLVDDDPYVFGSTIVENVRLARPEASDREVREALDAAHLGPWLDALPAGMHTHIGEGSAHVSGGERARLAVARALLADQPILVLDEPTAHLDARTAQLVTDEILRQGRGRSLVWITHGTIGLDSMDEVVRLEADEHEPAAL